MRVAIISHGVTDQSLLGGPGRVAAEHAKALAQRGHEVTVVTTDIVLKGRRAKVPTFQLVEQEGVSVYCARAYSASSWPGSLGPVVALGATPLVAKAVRWADVVHGHEWPHSLVQKARSLAHEHGKGLVIQPHGSIQLRPMGWKRLMHNALNRRRPPREQDNFIVGSTGEADEVRAVLRISPSVYELPNPMPATMMTEEDPRVAARRESWGCPPGSCVLLYAHRIVPNKGLDIGIRALAVLPRHYHLVVVGEGSGYPAFAEECKSLVLELGVEDRVKFVGPVGRLEVDEVIMAADVFVLPARRDTFPLMVLHALSCRRPVVVTSGCQSVEGLRGAVVVADPEPRNFADAISSLSPSKAATHVQAGCALLRERYSPASVAGELERIYTEVRERLEGQG